MTSLTPLLRHYPLELKRQVNMIEVNAHPFYNPSAFSSKGAYRVWRMLELQRLGLARSALWQGAEPETTPHADDYAGSDVIVERVVTS